MDLWFLDLWSLSIGHWSFGTALHKSDQILHRLGDRRQQLFGVVNFSADLAAHLYLEKRLAELGGNLIDDGRQHLQDPPPDRKEVQVQCASLKIHGSFAAETHGIAI